MITLSHPEFVGVFVVVEVYSDPVNPLKIAFATSVQLSLFASSKEIREGGVLALTPTGKSRVQLENHFREAGAEADFMTVAQFLVRMGW